MSSAQNDEGYDVMQAMIFFMPDYNPPRAGLESQAPNIAIIVPQNVIAINATRPSTGIMLNIKWDTYFRKFLLASMILEFILASERT